MLPTSVSDYLGLYGPLIAEKVRATFTPLHCPARDAPIKVDLVRPSLAAQAHVITAVCKAWETEKSVILAAECGTGKSYMFAAACHANAKRRPYRVLVFCPDHLVAKWRREIAMTIPNADVTAIMNWRDTFKLPQGTPARPFYCVVGRNTSKWLSCWKPAYIKRGDALHCPKCGQQLIKKMDKQGEATAYTVEELTKRKTVCQNEIVDYTREGEEIVKKCGEQLWQFFPKFERWSPAKIIHDRFRYYFDYLILDEIQEVKQDDNLQSNAAGTLIASCKKVIAGTGTLIGGYAKDVRALMFRLTPDSLKAEGLDWKDSMEFNRRYGLIETSYTTREGPNVSTRNGRGRSNSKQENVKPGTMPTLYARHLIGSTVFLSLKDVADNLPGFREIPVAVPLGDIADNYNYVESVLRAEVKELLKKKNRVLLGKMLHTLLCYPDHPYNWKEIGYYKKHNGTEIYVPVITPPALPANKVYPKEKKLLEILREEKRQGRQVWVFVEYTGTTKGDHPVRDRIAKIVQLAGFSCKVLDSNKVKLVDREKWITENGMGVDVMISHPQCVATGLDFFDREKTYNFPSIVFYEEGYQLVPMRQAGRRAYRIGQFDECRVYYLYYEGSMQERAMNLMGRKMAESLAIEGNFSSDGLDAILADHDTATMELAKSLAEKLDFGETERTWKKVDSVENDSPKRKEPPILPKKIFDKQKLLEALRVLMAERERSHT